MCLTFSLGFINLVVSLGLITYGRLIVFEDTF